MAKKHYKILIGSHRDRDNVDYNAKYRKNKNNMESPLVRYKNPETGVVYPDIIESEDDLVKKFGATKFALATAEEIKEHEQFMALRDGREVEEVDEAEVQADLESQLEGDDRGANVTAQFDTDGISGLAVYAKNKKYSIYVNDVPLDDAQGLKKTDVQNAISQL